MPERSKQEERILVLAPTGRDAALACQILTQVGLACHPCLDEASLFAEIEAGAGTAILAEEALQPWTIQALAEVLGRQEPWSDLPLIVFARGGGVQDNILSMLSPLSNATILERPVRVSTLLFAVQAALRARRRQFEVRDLLHRQAEADRRKDEFLAMLGHELRNPLAAIRNALWILSESGSAEERDVRQREIIERQTHHLVRMVDDLLDVSRVTLGKIILKQQTVDLAEVAQRCLGELGLGALAATHDLTVETEAEPARVAGDPVRLEQVICNLLQNAIKYTPPGGRIFLSVHCDQGSGVVRVRDTGVGISEDMLPRIFEPFTQVESSRTRSEGGLGLGLPLVRSLVELHHGEVEAHSGGPGRGSEFVVRLPLRKGERAAARPPRQPEHTATSPSPNRSTPDPALPLRVLVVEDNEDGRESLRDLLELWGHEVELAENGTQGVEKALALHPDVALVDIGLPGIDGNEVARRIRAVFGTANMELIAMTGYGQAEDRRRAMQAGFDNYLVKPVDPAHLGRLLTAARSTRAVPSQARSDAGEDLSEGLTAV
ncbi:MAG TPA: ATP-binding protein [Thermoanaerobaculia bacterium]|nr:ATP-binding protein [Thermoanaerobaculia bacterium]